MNMSNEKILIDSEIDKNTQIFQFLMFYAFFSQTFDKLRRLECWKGSTRKKSVVQYAQWRVDCSFSNEKCLELTSKKRKVQNLLFLSFLFTFCRIIVRLCGLEC